MSKGINKDVIKSVLGAVEDKISILKEKEEGLLKEIKKLSDICKEIESERIRLELSRNSLKNELSKEQESHPMPKPETTKTEKKKRRNFDTYEFEGEKLPIPVIKHTINFLKGDKLIPIVDLKQSLEDKFDYKTSTVKKLTSHMLRYLESKNVLERAGRSVRVIPFKPATQEEVDRDFKQIKENELKSDKKRF